MKSHLPATIVAMFLMLVSSVSSRLAHAGEDDDAIAACLAAWRTHPFGDHPSYTILGASIKVFSVGSTANDIEQTSAPALILVKAGVNVLGEDTISLMNPNGWYCLRANVNVMGGMKIRLHCKAHLASGTGSATVLGDNSSNRGVTVLGTTTVERVDCR